LNLCVAIGLCGIPGPKIGWAPSGQGIQHWYNIVRSETQVCDRLNLWSPRSRWLRLPNHRAKLHEDTIRFAPPHRANSPLYGRFPMSALRLSWAVFRSSLRDEEPRLIEQKIWTFSDSASYRHSRVASG
jgi:hypothetical protein